MSSLAELEETKTTEQIKAMGVWPYTTQANYTKQSFFNSFVDISGGDLILQNY